MRLSTSTLAVLVLSLGAALGRASDAVDRAFPGRFPSPCLEGSGRLSVLYVDPAGSLRLGDADSPGEGRIVRAGGGARAPMFPRLKEDRAGALWSVWAEGDGLAGGVVLGRLGDDPSASGETVSASSGTCLFPDLDFDAANRAWIAWVNDSGGLLTLRVREPGGRISRVGPESPASISGVRILAGGSSGVWLFWTGRDSGRDEIFYSRRTGTAWSEAARLNEDNTVPHLFLDAALDSSGRPRVVWSSFDGRAYRVHGSRWDGFAWSPEEALTREAGSDAFPALAFAGGSRPILVWSRTTGLKTVLCAKILEGPDSGREIELVSIAAGAVTDLRLSGRGNKLAVLWQSGDAILSRSFRLEDIPAGKEFSAAATTVRTAAATDENAYIAFGDDNTYGVIDGSPAPELGYVPRLQTTIEANYGQAAVSNDGVIGESTVSGLGRISDVLAARGARYLLLMEGTNDVIIPGISSDASAFNIEQMIRQCFDAQVLPILGTIIPRNDNYWNQLTFRKRLYDINDAIALTAINLKVASVDVFLSFWSYPAADGGWPALLSDGVHPNELGYDVMAQAWWTGIRNLPFPPTGLTVGRTTERSLLMTRSLNYLTWNHNPKILNPFRFRSYRIFRRDLTEGTSGFTLLASVPYSPFHNPQKYNDLDIIASHRYEYVVTLLRIDGIEGPYSDPAAETD
jgi:lysophospholipase L1-like esterase